MIVMFLMMLMEIRMSINDDVIDVGGFGNEFGIDDIGMCRNNDVSA